MECIVQDCLCDAFLYNPAEIHYGDAVRDVTNDADIVGYEQVGKAVLITEIHQQIDDLGLYRHIESTDRLVADD